MFEFLGASAGVEREQKLLVTRLFRSQLDVHDRFETPRLGSVPTGEDSLQRNTEVQHKVGRDIVVWLVSPHRTYRTWRHCCAPRSAVREIPIIVRCPDSSART